MEKNKLHMADAIEIVLAEKDNSTMHASDIAAVIAAKGLYVQKNGKFPVYNHVRARAGQRSDLFECLTDNFIRLKKRYE